MGKYFPKSYRFEDAYLALALHDDTQSGGLDAAGRKAVTNLFPDQAGEIIADESVEHAPRFLCLTKIGIYSTRMFQRFLNRFFGNLMKDDPFRILQAHSFCHMPGNRFSLAIRVGGEQHFIS